MTVIDTSTAWFNIVEVTCFDLDEAKRENIEYIDKLSARIRQLFNQTRLCSYPCLHKVVFDNVSEFKQYFTPLIKDFTIMPICTSIKNPHSNALTECIHQVFYNMIVTKDLDRNFYDYIDPWG